MRVPRIYTSADLAAGESHTLDAAAAQHVAKVLRMQPGQVLVLFNGDGLDYPATISHVGKKEVIAALGPAQQNELESPLKSVLGQVISRGDRMDYAIQKSVEMGVTTIAPLVSERCEVRLKGDREEKRLRHWQGVAIAAAEQCGRALIPTIAPVMTLDEWLDYSENCDLKLVLHHRTEKALTELSRPDQLALLVGPEGGLSEDEIAQAERAGFLPAAMGPRVLRTETAPVAALALCQWLWGDGGYGSDYTF
ncbi:MAG: 16S rRNA (uracil(1498)-N(3))-methyltransferase [Oleiphilaceae bacterium]|nr:16S rRNA (uracil(1498)-N(3))-methyltransferase [Oleiphilaceae bacterium]